MSSNTQMGQITEQRNRTIWAAIIVCPGLGSEETVKRGFPGSQELHWGIKRSELGTGATAENERWDL